MFEIEIKAHVYDREKLVQKIKENAEFLQKVQRDDTYYSKPVDNPEVYGKDHISIRIRKETKEKDGNKDESYYITYKRKLILNKGDKKSSEVNDEKESLISDPVAIEAFLKDAGFSVSLKKTKIVEDYKYIFCGIEETLELCKIPELGDFLEIEVLSETNDEQTVSRIRNGIIKTFLAFGISENDFETRFYSELLSDARNRK